MKRRVISFIIVLALCLNLCPTWALAAESQDLDFDTIVTLTRDENMDTPYEVSDTMMYDTAQYTHTGTKSTAMVVTGTGVLVLNGTVVSKKGAGVEVQPGGRLYLGENTSITGTTCALEIAEGAVVSLGEGCAAFDGSGNALSPDQLSGIKTLTVSRCENHTKGNYTPVSGAPTHTWTCAYCGTTGTEKCTFSFVRDGNGTSACADCGNGIAIVVNQEDLSNLIYDGTLKPEQVGVTVTLTDGTVLTKDTDYTVNIKSITEAGQATVTVTGITFNGEFVKTYTVAQATPGISWDNTNWSVDYDGSAVTASELPAIDITINTQTGEDLHPFLKYQYQKDGETGFTDGLPTNAGAYQVKAYLEDSQNYEAAETDPLLSLTVNQINPIADAPSAKTLMYNRNPQALVTSGALDPVAVKDGLELQFAREENGSYSTAIPTETNAGLYTVWYQVTGLTDNYIAPNPNPAEIKNVEILRKNITPVVELSDYTYLYDGGFKRPTVTVKDIDHVTVLLDTEYTVTYENNRDVSTDANPAKVIVTDSDANGGNYDLDRVEVPFKITSKTQDTLSITQKPDTIIYGDQFTLGTTGGSDSGSVTWEITAGPDVARVGQNSGQVTIIGDGTATVKATKSGGNNYEDAVDTWEFTAEKKPVTATVTAEDKTYDGTDTAKVHATVASGDLAFPDDVITITAQDGSDLTGTFSDANAGEGKTVTVDFSNAKISGNHSEHYAVSYSSTTVTATINKATATITTKPVPASLTYDGTAQALIGTAAVVDPTSVQVEYALKEGGPYDTAFPEGTNAGRYTVWYRVKETPNYTGLAPASIDVTIAKKQVTPAITLTGDGLQTDNTTTPPTQFYIYDGTAKEPTVTLYEADGTTVIPDDEYTVEYSGNTNVGVATVTVTAKDGGNYAFDNASVTAAFAIKKEQAKVLTAPKAAGLPLTFTTYAQELVTAGTAFGGTMVYRVGDTGDFESTIPTEIDAGTYKIYYMAQGDANHSNSEVCAEPITVTIAPKTVKDPTIELYDGTNPLVSYTYDGTAKEPKVVVKDGSTVIDAGKEYNIVYSDNTDAGHGTVNITDKLGGNYEVTGSKTFVINKADIVDPNPQPAVLTYNGTAQELLTPGATSGGTVQYALNSATSTFTDAIPTATNAGTYSVYYKVTGDKNHNDLTVQGPVSVTIGRKPLTDVTIELTPDSFDYDGKAHLPDTVTVKFKEGRTETVVPGTEYDWTCNVENPTGGGTYTITISDAAGGNYDLTNATPNSADFTIGQAPQKELVIKGKLEHVYYGDTVTLTTDGGSGNGGLTWSATGPATMNNGTLIITGTGDVNVTVTKDGDKNYQGTSAHWTFTAAPKPVTAAVTVSDKFYDGNTTATVASADINAGLVTGDTVTIDETSITAAFEDPHVGANKTVTLDASKVKVTGDAAKYDISYPATVTANIDQATTTVTAPRAIDPLTYSGQPQALIEAGQTNVGFLEYSLDGANFSPEIPAGTNAGAYTVYYKVVGTADYTEVAMNGTPISVTIGAKSITPKIELSETSYVYDGAPKSPKVTLKDGDTVIPESQYEVKWTGPENQQPADLLKAVGTYTATIKNVTGGNYSIDVSADVVITPAEQAAITITGKPEHVYYGDVLTNLSTDGGTGNGTVTWSVTAGKAAIEEGTGKLTITGVGVVTVKAARSVPNYGTAEAVWNFTVEPKPVTAEVTVAAKDYDGTTDVDGTAITAQVKDADLVSTADRFALSGLTGSYEDANAGTGKTVTLDDTSATKADGNGKYVVSYPATAKGNITAKAVTVTVTLSDHDLKLDGGVQYYDFDGTEKKPNVTVKYSESGTDKVIPASNYTVEYSNNKNVSANGVKAAVTVKAETNGNYSFPDATANFEIRSAAAALTSSPQAKDLTYEKGTEQELVTAGVATGGTVVYKLSTAADSDPDVESGYGTAIPKAENAGAYTVYYKVKGDANHDDSVPSQATVTIKPKQITPAITLSDTTYTYDGTAKTPTVTVMDNGVAITNTAAKTEYTVSYRDNIDVGTATVTVSNANGSNYSFSGTATFTIKEVAPTVTAPTGKTGLYYTGEAQELLSARGTATGGTLVYSLSQDGPYSTAIPTAKAVGTHEVWYMVQGDANHSDTTPVKLTVGIVKNAVGTPAITLTPDQFTYTGNPQKPTVTVKDGDSRLIPESEYAVAYTDAGNNAVTQPIDVGTYTVTVTTPDTSNYVINSNNTRTFEIKAADQEAISITGAPAQVTYGDKIQLEVSGGTGNGTVTWKVKAKDGSSIGTDISAAGGLLTVRDVNTPITVTVTRSRGGNYTDVSATWEFSAAKKPVTAVLTGVDRSYIAGDVSATVKAKVDAGDLVFGDTLTIGDLTGAFDNENVGTNKTITVTGTAPVNDKYEVTIPATATASILAVAATVKAGDEPNPVGSLTYDAAQTQALVTAGTATGGTMIYSLDGTNFSPSIPKGKDAGKYTVYYKAQGDQNHMDSEVKTVEAAIGQQTVTPQIELTPPSAPYDSQVKRPKAIVRDTANNIIPDSEYTVVYEPTTNWTDVGTHKVTVQNVTGGNYIINEATADFEISTSAQAPLEIVDKPGLVHYGDDFTLSATGGSASGTVTWSVDDAGKSVVEIDANGLVKVIGVGPATIKATKPGGTNYEAVEATYPLNALKKPVTVTVTADDKVYDGNTNATIHFTWNGLVGNDEIVTTGLKGTFADADVGNNKTVTITGTPTSDTTAQKYDFTIPATTTASITKEAAKLPETVAGNTLTYDGTAQALVIGGVTGKTLYSDARDGVYSADVPTGTNAGTYTVWCKQQGDDNHTDSEPKPVQAAINPKTLTDANVTITLSGSDLKTDTTVTPNVYYYEYDGTDKTPTVTIVDGAATVPAVEYKVTYSGNKDAGTATVAITDNEGGNYVISVTGTVSFEIRAGRAQLTRSPQANNLTYTGAAQELVSVGAATGGHLEYKLTSTPTGEPALSGTFRENIPTGTVAGSYTVDYKVVGDGSYTDGPEGSVTVTIQPKTVVSPTITVDGGPFTYDNTAKTPTVTIVDGTATIDDTEYTLSYQNNVNAGTATVIVTDNNGGNYTVNGTGTFTIQEAAPTVTAPTGKTGLKYNGTAQELITAGSSDDGTMVYSLTEGGAYSAAIPTGKNVDGYTVYYKVLGDGNHTDSDPQSVAASIVLNEVTNPTIQVEPATVKYTGEKQEPTVTVKDDVGLLIDSSEYTVAYTKNGTAVTELKDVGIYTGIITRGGNYTFDATDSKNTFTFEILQADQTPLNITGTRERVYYGDTIPLGTTGGNGEVTWDVGGSTIADIDTNGLLTIKGVGSVTVTATSKRDGYADQTAVWNLYAEKKPVTAIVTAKAKTYDGEVDAEVTATLQTSDFVGADRFTITLTGCTFEDANAGTDKRVIVNSTNPTVSGTNSDKYAISYPATVTASITKADVTSLTAPAAEAAANLVYTGLPLALVTEGSSPDGTMEYSLDGKTYSASLPTGTDAGNYDVWYRVKGDGNHNDTTGAKLGTQVTIAPQTVDADKLTIEFTPSGASYDGAVHKPSVTVKDGNNRVIPAEEYTVTYSNTDWKTASSATVKHEVTVTDKNGGNYAFTEKTAKFTISMMGQNPLTIVGQPGRVQYGDSFTLSTSGGSGTGAVTWDSSDKSVATIGSNGLVTILKSGATTITATKAADANYGAVSVTWALSVEKKPVAPIVTARDKEYDTTDTATLAVTWKDGDLVGNDANTITLNLAGKFDTADVGTGKTVAITGTAPNDDRYAITIPSSTTASITPKAASVSGSTAIELTYDGSAQPLVTGVTPTNGDLVYSTDGSYYTQLVPTGTDAGTYPVWYKAQGSGNYKDSEVVRLNVTIEPKKVESPVIELSRKSFEYDGNPKKPDVTVKDGNTLIPASEYTVGYSSNTEPGTATVTISDNAGGNYTVNGSKTFTITAAKATLTTAPQAKTLTYTGASQELVSRGAADNGTVVYSQTETGSYTTTIPRETNAGSYEVWYKVQNTDGTDAISPQYLSVTIARKTITTEVLLDPEECTYSGDPCTPDVFVLDLDSNDLLDPDTDYTVRYMSNTKVGTARVIVVGKGNYSFSVTATFEIVAAKAKFNPAPTAITGLTYNGTAQALVTAGAAEGGTPCYSLDGVSYLPTIPTATDRGSYTVYAKVQGDSTHEDSDFVTVPVEIGVNTLSANDLTVSLSATSFPYTGGEQKPTVTVTDNGGNVISADEYTVTYSDNVNVGTAKVSIKSKTNGNYSFTAEATFSIIDANQTPLAIGGKKDTVYYGDTLQLTATGGPGTGTVTWSSSDKNIADIDANGTIQKIETSGSVTITATKGSLSDSWTFYAQPKPITAVVTAANKSYDGNNTATLTVTISSGLVGSDSITTNTDGGVKAEGHFSDETVGTNKTVVITGLTVPAGVSAKYDIGYNNTTTASINPAAAEVKDVPTLAGSLTYNGGARNLLASGGTAVGGNLAYSLDGNSYSYTIPTGTDAGKYTVWYKVEASDENHRDSAAVKLGDVTISANTDPPTVLCTPSTFQYDSTEKTPTVVVRDSQNRIIPESEYTVELPTPRIAVGTYTVTINDRTGGNYDFTTSVTGAFKIVAASQNPLSITDKPAEVHYGDTFRLSAIGGSGGGAIQWSIPESSVATINDNGVVTVIGAGGFTVKAYRAGADGYSDSNTDSAPFEAKAKPVTPVVTVADKSYDGNTNATLNARFNSGDLVGTDTITLTVEGQFATADAGVNKQVNITGHTAVGENVDVDKYVITWPDSVTGTINKVDAKLDTAPAAADLTYTGEALPLVTAGETVNGIGTIEYSTSQNGAYSENIPTETNAGKYEVWYKVADSVNYTGIAPAVIHVEIKKATPSITTAPTASGGVEGDPLSNFSLGGAVTEVRGTFAWENPETLAVAGTAYNVIFTPEDTNYSTRTIEIVAVGSTSNGGGTGTGGGSSGGGTSGGSGGGSGSASNGTGGSISNDADTLTYSTGAPVVQGNTASFAMSAFDGSRMARQATANQSKNIVIKPEITGDVTKTQVSIPASTASQINSQTDAALTVASPIADVTIPNGALDTLGRAGGTVNVVTEQTDGGVALTLSAGGKTVDSVPGGVTLAVPAENAGPGTVAVRVNEDGTRETVQKSVVKDGKVSVPLEGSATVEIVDNSKNFDDVSSTDWEADAVAFASAHELLNGTSETTFSPDENMSRGMLTTVLYRLEGQPDQEEAVKFSDVSSESWYTDSITWATQNGIVDGYGDGQFGPDDSITREQFAVMLWRYAGSPAAGSQDLAFTDAEKASSYAEQALRWAVEKGIMSGYPNGELNPGGTATRAEAAQMLKNFLEKI